MRPESDHFEFHSYLPLLRFIRLTENAQLVRLSVPAEASEIVRVSSGETMTAPSKTAPISQSLTLESQSGTLH